MKRRIFVAITLPEIVRNFMGAYQSNHKDVPARWTAIENLHITVAFIGDVDDSALPSLCEVVKGIAEKHEQFVVRLSNIGYDSADIIPPRMIWAFGEGSGEFALLCDSLLAGLSSFMSDFIKNEKREPIPHITLARIKGLEWRRIEPDERPEVGEFVDIEIPVNSIQVMESVLKKQGPEYKILESYKLSK